jgi:hypothetical protein
MLLDVVMIQAAQRQLLEIVLALTAARRFAGGLNRGQEQRHQDADDGDHHQQLDERETM